MQTVNITNLPSPLSGESFQCVFGGFGSGELTMVGGDMFSKTCSVPSIPSFVGVGEHSSIFTGCICSMYSIIAVCTYTQCMNIH